MFDLILDSRPGLPDELAYLRSSYPAANWRKHSNFGELSDFWLHVHDHLRGQGSALREAASAYREGQVDTSRFRQFLVPSLNQFLQHLSAHHHIEDHSYFPKFRLLDPRMVAGFDLLERDHGVIHEALLATAQAANEFLQAPADAAASQRSADAYAAAADQLLALLTRHLADEEDLIIPAMLHHGERSLK